jgi:hypothetical protein
VLKCGDRFRLALKTLPRLRRVAELGREDLDGHIAPEARVPRAIDLPHAARADGGKDLVGARCWPVDSGIGAIDL